MVGLEIHLNREKTWNRSFDRLSCGDVQGSGLEMSPLEEKFITSSMTSQGGVLVIFCYCRRL